MRSLSDVLTDHFRINRGRDNMPVLARHLRNGGRGCLAEAMRDMGVKRGVEIGTRRGRSAELWCKTIPGLDLTCIDPYTVYHTRRSQEGQDAIFAEATQRMAAVGARIIRAKSVDVANEFKDGSLDFVNIDGDHTFDAAALDIIMYAPKVRRGGLILIHDYCSFQASGVIKAVDAYTHCHDIRPWYVTKEHQPTAFWEKGAERL